MKRPANQTQAAAQTAFLLRNRLPGGRKRKDEHLKRSAIIAEMVWKRWRAGPAQWKVKHLRWYLGHHCQDLASGTLYRHWLTVRILVHALGKETDWIPLLRGPWLRPTGVGGKLDPEKGGRPTRMPISPQG